MFLRYSRPQKDYKRYCSEVNHFIIYVDITFFESKSYFNTKSHSSETNKDFVNFLVHECSSNNNASLDITDQSTLPTKHGEQPKSTRHTSTMPPSSAVPFSTLQSDEFLLHNLIRMFCPLVMLLSFFLILVLKFLIWTFRLLFERVNALGLSFFA